MPAIVERLGVRLRARGAGPDPGALLGLALRNNLRRRVIADCRSLPLNLLAIRLPDDIGLLLRLTNGLGRRL